MPLRGGGKIRIGLGFDIHRLVEGRDLILGGVTVPFEKGLLGHSDGDVLCHAIGDAILGALCMGDLGTHFPDTDPKYRGVSSLGLLQEIAGKIQEAKIINIDASVICEQPKLAHYIPEMRKNIARVFKVASDQVSVKAKTAEGLGVTGKGKGISCYAVVGVE